MKKMGPFLKGQHMPQSHISLDHENYSIISGGADCLRYFTWILSRASKPPIINIVVLIFQLGWVHHVIKNIGWPAWQHHSIRWAAIIVLGDILFDVLSPLR